MALKFDSGIGTDVFLQRNGVRLQANGQKRYASGQYPMLNGQPLTVTGRKPFTKFKGIAQKTFT